MDHEVPTQRFNFDALETAYSYWKGGFPDPQENNEINDMRFLM